MATGLHSLSEQDLSSVPDASGMRFAIVVAEWNREITEKLKEGACQTLLRHGVSAEDITVVYVPGSFELVYGAGRVATALQPDAVIGIGSVIRGETPHFEYVCSGVTQGFAQLNAQGTIPFIFGLLTDDNLQQSIDRSGGKYGNKGDDCAIAAIKMAALACRFK